MNNLYVASNSRESGFSLTELLIAMALAIFLISGLVQGVVSSKTTFNSINAQTELQQNGRAALFFLEKEILKAGYINELNVATRFDETKLLEVWPKRKGVFEEVGVFINGNIQDPKIKDKKADTDAILVRYKVVDSTASSISVCGGADKKAELIKEIDVTFYVSKQNELKCKYTAFKQDDTVEASKNQTMLDGIEDLKVRYGIADTTTMPPKVTQYLTAENIGGNNQPKWSDVIGVSLSLLVTSDSQLGAQAIDQGKENEYEMQGTELKIKEDGKLRQVFTTTQGLRNRL